MNQRFFVIEPAYVGKRIIRVLNRTVDLTGVLGQVLPQDVGKRVYISGDRGEYLQAESNEQRDRRLAGKGEPDPRAEMSAPTLRPEDD